ncbi:RNase P modulator RnpM [Oribacterium sp. HCP28S3_H8]|uniref:RNase P modulator RnpM n=1 Tax=Oribacterium sp. HCP28S3_H8 TaxID=3438945 RepID=UPI003F8B87B3
MKKIPQRTCIGCGMKKDKKELVRIVRTPEGTLQMDLTGRMNGRGAYVCRDTACLDKALKRKALQRSLKEEISEDVILKLKEEFKQLDQ